MTIHFEHITVIMPKYDPTDDIKFAMQQSSESAQIRVLDKVLNDLTRENGNYTVRGDD